MVVSTSRTAGIELTEAEMIELWPGCSDGIGCEWSGLCAGGCEGGRLDGLRCREEEDGGVGATHVQRQPGRML